MKRGGSKAASERVVRPRSPSTHKSAVALFGSALMRDLSPECETKAETGRPSELGSRDVTGPYSANSVQMIHDFLSLTKAIYH